MPATLDRCVSQLTGNPKFRPRRKGQTKQQAAHAVCKTSLGVKASEEFDESKHQKDIDLIEKHYATDGDTAFSHSSLLVDRGEIPKTFELLRTGFWDHPFYGEFHITKETIDDFITSFEARLTAKGPNFDDNQLPINLDHDKGGPAAGWIHKLSVKEDGEVSVLVAHVQWTEMGVEQLTKKLYKYVSAELSFAHEDAETREKTNNVMTGAGLTNIPYFKSLTPLTMSQKTASIKKTSKKEIKNKQGEEMKFKELLTKKASELTKKQIETLKKAFDADKLGAKDALKFRSILAPVKKTVKKIVKKNKDLVEINSTELEMLKKTADKVEDLEAKELKRETEKFVEGLTYSEGNKEGRFLPKSKKALTSFAEKLGKKSRERFAEVIKTMPELDLFDEKGTGGSTNVSGASDLDIAVKKTMKKDKLTYSEALAKIRIENPELIQSYSQEIK